MAQIYSQPVHAYVKVVLSIEVSEELKALLTAQGWTPPGEEPVLNSEHRRILAEQAASHRNAMAKLQERHRIELDRMAKENNERLDVREKRIREEYSACGRHAGCVAWADHTAALRDHAGYIRRVVAEEIAVDLEKPREWRISPDKPGPWATVARAHAGGKPSEIPFPPNLITWSGQNCATFGCALDHGNR